jgi:2'-5' RNA ligase
LIIVKDRNLLEIHEMIWRRTIQYAIQPNMHYAPENWIPHITLNLNPLTEDQFRCSVDELTSRPLNFEFVVNKLGLIYLTAANSGIDSIYPLRNSGINQ